MARLGDDDSTCEQCNGCGLLWCSVSLRCFCGGDGSCGGELLADTHAEQIQRNKEIAEWCPDAWSSCAESMLGCQSRNDDCSACLDRSACSWCVYKDAIDATAAMCIFNGAIGGQTRRCLDVRSECPVVETVRQQTLDVIIAIPTVIVGCMLLTVFLAIWKEKQRRRLRRERQAAALRARGSGQDAHGADSLMRRQQEEQKQRLKLALALLPTFEFGKLAPPPEGTPLDQLPTFEQRQLELSTGGLVDDRKISRSESMPPAPVERPETKPVKSLRAKSLMPNLGKQNREEFSSGLDELVTCSICLSGYHDDATSSMLPCGHIFHRKCIHQWLQSGRTTSGDCPLCKEPILQGTLEEDVEEAFSMNITAPKPAGRARIDPTRRELDREVDAWAGPTGGSAHGVSTPSTEADPADIDVEAERL